MSLQVKDCIRLAENIINIKQRLVKNIEKIKNVVIKKK